MIWRVVFIFPAPPSPGSAIRRVMLSFGMQWQSKRFGAKFLDK